MQNTNKECCEKCDRYFVHDMGSHSDSRDTEPCYCNQGKCGKPDCKCHLPTKPTEKPYCGGCIDAGEKYCLIHGFANYKPTPAPVGDWEEVFLSEMCDEKFYASSSDLTVKAHPKKVIDFIRSLREADRKRIVEEATKIEPELCKHCQKSCYRRCKCVCHEQFHGFNKAKEQLITFITNLK